jgi:hypothetical protein
VRADLSHTIAQVAVEMGQIQRVQSLASSFIRTHFERKSPDQVKVGEDLPVATALSYSPPRRQESQLFAGIREIFQVFDINGDKQLDATELIHAFSCMVEARRYSSIAHLPKLCM